MTNRTRMLSTTALHALAHANEPGPVTPGFVADPATAVARGVGTQGTGNAADDPYMRRAPDMLAMVPYWDLSDCIVDGLDAMKLAGKVYLPMFPDEDAAAYAFRLSYAKMTNVFRDSCESLSNKPFEKEVTLVEDENNKPPEQALEFCEDVDGSGNNLTAFAVSTFFNGIVSAIDWIMVDYDKPDPNVRTVADAKDAGVRPYWSHVLGRNVLEARVKVIAGKEVLTYARVLEPGKVDRVRVFERNASGVVTWELREKRDTEIDSPLGRTRFHIAADDDGNAEKGTITIGVIPLVPFYTGRRDGRTFKFFPAMRDAADLQVNLYRSECGLEHIKVLAGYPMLAANGIAPPKDAAGKVTKLAVGPGRVLYSIPDGAGNYGSWAYVQPDAALLTFLESNIENTINQLREIARQPLTAQSGNITTITAAISAGKAKSAVGQWGLALKNALENAMVLTMMWMGVKQDTYDPAVYVYTDFDEFTEGKDLETIDADRERGDISRETLWEEKKRRGIYSDEFTPEREEQRLLDETPSDTGDDIDPDAPPVTGTKPAPRVPRKAKTEETV
jgi:hypothetical protein